MCRVPIRTGRRLSMPSARTDCEIASVIVSYQLSAFGSQLSNFRFQGLAASCRRCCLSFIESQRWSRRERLVENRVRLAKLVPFEREARRANARASHADALLRKLDELHELWHGIHPKQRQEPAIQRERLVASGLRCEAKQRDGFGRER